MKSTLTLLSALALAGSLAFAQEAPARPKKGPGKDGPPPPERVFKKLDTDKNGSLSHEEFKAGPRAQKNPEKAEEAFKKMDANSDGSLTLEEFKAGHPKKGEHGKGGKGGKKGGADQDTNPPAEP